MLANLYPTFCAFLRASAMFAALTLLWAQSAGAAKLRVRGSAELDARAVQRNAGTELRGVLSDDTGRPIGGAQIRVSLEAEAGTQLPPPRACRSTTGNQLHHTSNVVVVDTDGAGAFCFLFPNTALTGALRVRFEGDKFFDRLERRVQVGQTRRSLGLAFAPEPRVLSLDRKEHVIHVETRVDPPFERGDSADPIAVSLELLQGPTVTNLAEINLAPGDRGSFTPLVKQLGQPGPAKLRVRFAGNRGLSSAESTTHVHKTARVTVTLAQDVAPVRSGEDAVIRVAASSALGALETGAIEVLSGNRSLGTATVQSGAAVWRGPIFANEGTLLLSVRYLPGAPWWLAAEPISVPIVVRPPSPWRSLPWLLVAVAIGAWVLRGWRRPLRAKRAKESEPLATGRESVEVVAPGKPRSGWNGVVVDAHEGTAIANATVSIRLPSFEAESQSVEACCDAEGAFVLPDCPVGEGAELEAHAVHHTTLRRPVPAPGRVVIRMISRRRAVLARLVAWAERRGPPWKPKADPTPAQVAQTARERRDGATRNWAQNVERAAFGPNPPDAAEEARIRQAEPGASAGGRER